MMPVSRIDQGSNVMKLMRSALVAVIALVAFDGMLAAAASLDEAGTVVDRGGASLRVSGASLRVKRHRPVRVYQPRHVYAGPQACDAVIFPRSPVCAPHNFFDLDGWRSAPFFNLGFRTRFGP
jgi:hypothetical protein